MVADLQDIRVGYDTINQTTSMPIRDMNERLAEGNKKALIDNIYAVDSFGESPLRQALDRAGKTFACETGNYCPRAEPPAGFCQQNFALLYTDGYWNGGAGVSSNEDADSAANRFDGGRYADAIAQTLADTAMYHYKRDFHPTYTNLVPISRLDQVGAAPDDIEAKVLRHGIHPASSWWVLGSIQSPGGSSGNRRKDRVGMGTAHGEKDIAMVG